MPKIQLENPLSFANFISCTDHSTLIFDHRRELVDAQTQELYADFSDADFAVGINFPPRIVSVTTEGVSCRLTCFDILARTEDQMSFNLPNGFELIDLAVAHFDGGDAVVCVGETEASTVGFLIAGNGLAKRINGWTQNTVFGDLNCGFFVDRELLTPEPDQYTVRLPGGRVCAMEGQVLSLGHGYLLEAVEEKEGYAVRCFSYTQPERLLLLWSASDCFSGRIADHENVALLGKVAGAQQQLRMCRASDGEVRWFGPEGHVSFGLSEAGTVHVATVDTIQGVTAKRLCLKQGEILYGWELLGPIDVDQSVLRLPFGGEAIFLRPKGAYKAVVSLHGGPESYEWSNLRYGGLYRRLLRDGFCVVIFNYAGSTHVGSQARTACHGSFADAVLEEFSTIKTTLAGEYRIDLDHVSLFGGSFGGTLALQIATHNICKRIAVSSPVCDLARHVKRLENEQDYVTWFTSRFSDKDFNSLSLDRLSGCRAKDVYVWHGEDDDICSFFDTVELVQRLSAKGKSVKADFPKVIGHVPRSPSELTSYIQWATAAFL